MWPQSDARHPENEMAEREICSSKVAKVYRRYITDDRKDHRVLAFPTS
jgi:hypothetical protein